MWCLITPPRGEALWSHQYNIDLVSFVGSGVSNFTWVIVRNSRNSCTGRRMMRDKLGTSFLFILGKALFLLPLKRILAGNGRLWKKLKEIRLAACLVQFQEQEGRIWDAGIWCSMTSYASQAEQFPAFPGSLSADTQTQSGALTFSAAPSRNLQEVDLTIPALISPRICFSKNVCRYSLRSCCLKFWLLFSWRSNQQVMNGCKILSCTEKSLYPGNTSSVTGE